MSLPERDEDFLRLVTESLNANPLRDLPGDDADNYIPEVTIKTVPKRLYEDTIADLREEQAEYLIDNQRLDRACRALTRRLNAALQDTRELRRLRQLEYDRRCVAIIAAVTGWAALIVAILLGR